MAPSSITVNAIAFPQYTQAMQCKIDDYVMDKTTCILNQISHLPHCLNHIFFIGSETDAIKASAIKNAILVIAF